MVANLFTQLGIDQTLWVQLAVFIFFYAWVRFVFFPPFLRLMSARNSQTTGLVSESEELTKRADAKEIELAQKLSEVRKEAAAEREKIIGEAKTISNAQLDKARKEAKKQIEVARTKAEGEQASELVNLKQEAHELSDLFVDKLTKGGARL